jgi:hypothetical protein
MSNLFWVVVVCPCCERSVSIGIMSLAASCQCGAYYADAPSNRGWYRSRSAYESGERPIE